MLLSGWWTREFMTLESMRYALCICVICFSASGYKENFPAGTIKMNWNWEDQSAETSSSSSSEQGFGSLLKVPSGVFIVNKQLSMFLTKHSGWAKICEDMSYLIKTFAKAFFMISNPALLMLACNYNLILLFIIHGLLSLWCIIFDSWRKRPLCIKVFIELDRPIASALLSVCPRGKPRYCSNNKKNA